MASNFYFSNFTNSMEQSLIEDLVIESIQIYGHDVFYLPRTLGTTDKLLNEDDTSSFNSSYLIEVFIKNVEGFGGENDFMSKFGLQIRDQMTFTMAIRKFNSEIGRYTGATRPNEGDLIYFPMNRKVFEITFVEHEAIFYQMGSLQTYDLKCELYEWSNERFATGVKEIDALYNQFDRTTPAAIADVETVDLFADNTTIEGVASTVLDFTENNPFGEDSY